MSTEFQKIKPRHIRYAVVAAFALANSAPAQAQFDDMVQVAWLAAWQYCQAGKSWRAALSRAKWAAFDALVEEYRRADAEKAFINCGEGRRRISEGERQAAMAQFDGRGQIRAVVDYALRGYPARAIAQETGLSYDAVRSYLSRACKSAQPLL